tara:strand:- start:58 stop:273 length:216 start_codon:yes stop_codon:yes gene_type:complete
MAKQNRFVDSKFATPRISQVEINGQVIKGVSPIGRDRILERARNNIEQGLDVTHDMNAKRELAVLRAEGLI